jgi:hypothetical protein
LIVTALEKAFGINLPKPDDQSKQSLKSLAIALASIAVITIAQLTAIDAMMGPAWALAEAVSLFSFGANAIPASAGIAAVVSAGSSAQAAKMAEGGLIRGPGTGRSDEVLIRASNGEFVTNADATAKNRSLLEAINQGNDIVQVNQSNAKQIAVAALEKAPITLPQSLSKFADGGFINVQTLPKFADGGIVGALSINRAFADGGFVGATTPRGMIIEGSDAVRANGSPNSSVGSGVKLNVNVVHDGTTGVKVEQIDENTVRIIARQEASDAVQTQGPKVLANDLYNPNSHASKAISRNFNITRKR